MRACVLGIQLSAIAIFFFNFQMEQLTSSENKLELKEEMVQALQTDIVVSY